MDHLRQVRFILAPLVFFGSLLFAGVEADVVTWREFLDVSPGHLAAIGGVIATATLPLGFVFGGVTQTVLHLFFFRFKKARFDALFDAQDWDSVWIASKTPNGMRTDSNKLYATVSLELSKARKNEGIIGWIDRRWNACYASMNSLTATVFSWFACPALGIEPGPFWWLLFFTLSAVWVGQAWITWHDVMGLIAFRAKLAANEGRAKPALPSCNA